jgi:hypothetical protein
MESYDEFARRAKIMTEVHAFPLVENATCDGTLSLKSASSSNPEVFKQSAVQKKEKDAKKKSLKRL